MPSDNSAPKNNISDIDQLIREAELMQIKLKLEIQFKKNMEFLKKGAPLIHKDFIEYSPENQKIVIDNDNNINLINIKSGNLAFNESPIEFAEKQVASAAAIPTRFITGFKPTKIVNKRHIHPIICNSALEQYETLGLKTQYNKDDPVGLMIIIGCGLGYHIERIVDDFDIYNIFIFDGNKDSFYATLFTIDWQNIANKINNKGGKLKLHIGESPSTVLGRCRTLPYEIGMYNMVATHALIHTDSKENRSFYESYKAEFHLYGTALGFFDDEQVAFAHTINNINDKSPIFKPVPKSENSDLPPVLIIGNGPSLDGLVDFIREAQEKVIIISCGSALASLYKLNITPDFHVELERNLTVAEMLKMGTTIEYTKKIPLLGLNNVSPETKKLFKSYHLAIKPNDIGSTILAKEAPFSNYFELPLCNPTVTNCGFSFAVSLGFNEIYLIGVDLGMAQNVSHHSKYSIWHQMDVDKEKNPENHQETLDDYTYSDGQYPVKGNLCETVITTNTLDSSKRNMEMLIDQSKDISVFNPNNGVYIKGTVTIEPTALNSNSHQKISDKSLLIKSLLDNNFYVPDIKFMGTEDVKEKYTSLYFKILPGLEMPDHCDTIQDIHNNMKRVFNNLKKLEAADRTTSMLVMGSIQVHFSMLYYFSLRAKTREDLSKCYQIGITHYRSLINQATEILKTDPLRLDDTGLIKEN